VIRFVYSPTTPDGVFNEGLKILGEVMSVRIGQGERLIF
jgi:hypothetical protein